MLRLRKVAITGGLSCGKTTVCRLFKELGAYVVSADEIVHKLLLPTTPLGKSVVELLGNGIVNDGRIDRSKIAELVFNDPKLLQSLEKIIHPAVFKEIERQYQELTEQGKQKIFIAEIPLLFEVGGELWFDKTIAIIADEATCKKRFSTLTGQSLEEYEKRMQQQLSPQEKAEKADFVLSNNGSLQDLKEAVTKLYGQIT